MQAEGQTARKDEALGRVLDGRYRIDSQLGIGGVGTVYQATQLALGRSVAIKLLHEGLDSSFRARFEREAKAMAALKHPNIVAISDYGVSDNMPYLVMELLQGETLAQRLKRGPLLPEHARDLARELLRALGFMHEQGLVHRDLKPSNLFLELMPDGEERLKLLDFGLAKFVEGHAGNEGDTVTRAGHAVGTPAYMAPEQVAGDTADARTDVYAMGILLFEMLSGRGPFLGDPVEQLRSHLIAEPPKLAQTRPDLYPCPELEALVARALSKKREARFPSANDMLNAIDALPERWLTPPEQVSPSTALTTLQEPARTTLPATGRASSGSWFGKVVLVIASAWILVSGYRAAFSDPPPPAAAKPTSNASSKQAKATAAPTAAEPEQTPLPPAPTTRPPTRNPWTNDTPELLRATRKASMNGERGSERSISALRRYNRATAGDSRGHLILARLYLNRGWVDDALTQYTYAYRVDPSSRNSAGMLTDLIKLVARGTSQEAAALLVRDAYGAEALTAVNSALVSFNDDAQAVTRLTALLDSLQ